METIQKTRYQQPIPFGWYCVSYSNELAEGEARPLFYFGEEMVIFRTESGEAKVLEAYCPHLGAHIGHGGKVKGESIACPFHGWQFNGEGICTDVPYAKRIPPKVDGTSCLYSYPTVERNRLIWVWYHPKRIAPLWEVEEVPETTSDDWTDYQCFDWNIKAIIQETGENAADTAHFVYVHGTAEVPQGEITMEGHRRKTDVAVKVPDFDNPGDENGKEQQWLEGRLLTSSVGPGQTVQHFNTYFQTVMLGSVTPIDNETIHLRFSFTQPKQKSEMQKTIADAAITEIARQVEQDIPIWEHKKYHEKPILCDGDGPIARYRKWFQQFYA